MDRASSHFYGNRRRVQSRTGKEGEELLGGNRIRNGLWNVLVGIRWSGFDASKVEYATLSLRHHGLAVVDGPRRIRNGPWRTHCRDSKQNAQVITETFLDSDDKLRACP